MTGGGTRGRSSADAGLISATLADGAALCLECLAKKTQVPIEHVEAVLARIGKTLRIASGRGSCHACPAMRTVFRLV
jgi:hypothetical protein